MLASAFRYLIRSDAVFQSDRPIIPINKYIHSRDPSAILSHLWMMHQQGRRYDTSLLNRKSKMAPFHSNSRTRLSALVVFLYTYCTSWILAFASNPIGAQHTVLVTGGAGYIGSHTCLELLNVPGERYKVIVLDNLDNSSEESIQRVRELVAIHSGRSASNRLYFRKCDIRDQACLEQVLDEFPEIDSCIHFAGLKAVGESVSNPLKYYDCNIGGTIHLLEALAKRNIKHIVFSSSATVYGEPEFLPLTEDAKLHTTNPYGRTKLVIEDLLRDVYAADPTHRILILRYFNPIGAILLEE